MEPRVEFGMFDWTDRGPGPVGELFEGKLRLIEEAERAGFFCYHLAEHHGTPLGMASSPAVFLAAASQRTKRIRLGPLVFLLPLYEPLRLFEEVCMLDHLTGGRIELGVGRGVSPYELACFGVDAAGTRPIFDEALEVLIRGFTQERLTFAGEHFRYDGVPVEIRPVQKPYPPLWYPTHNPASITYAARHGFHFVGLGPAPALKQQMTLYRETWEKHRHDAGRLNAHVTAPKLGTLRQIFVAETDEEAVRLAKPAHDFWFRSITKLWHDHQDHSVDGLFDWEGAIRGGGILIGSPRTVREQAAALLDGSTCNYLIGAFEWGSMAHEHAVRSVRLFAEEVMPALRGGPSRAA